VIKPDPTCFLIADISGCTEYLSGATGSSPTSSRSTTLADTPAVRLESVEKRYGAVVAVAVDQAVDIVGEVVARI
jgi:hypothetical protein